MDERPTACLHLLLDHTGYCWSEILALPGQVVDLDQVLAEVVEARRLELAEADDYTPEQQAAQVASELADLRWAEVVLHGDLDQQARALTWLRGEEGGTGATRARAELGAPVRAWDRQRLLARDAAALAAWRAAGCPQVVGLDVEDLMVLREVADVQR